ncbi:hypothetical protein RCL1_005391 [Eukaryota sp. TZLM3-RCL]
MTDLITLQDVLRQRCPLFLNCFKSTSSLVFLANTVKRLLDSNNHTTQNVGMALALLLNYKLDFSPSLQLSPLLLTAHQLSTGNVTEALQSLYSQPSSEFTDFLCAFCYAKLNNPKQSLTILLPLLNSQRVIPEYFALSAILLTTPSLSLSLLSSSPYDQSLKCLINGLKKFPENSLLIMITCIVSAYNQDTTMCCNYLSLLLNSIIKKLKQNNSVDESLCSVSFNFHESASNQFNFETNFFNPLSVFISSLPNSYHSFLASFLSIAAFCFSKLSLSDAAMMCCQRAGALIPGYTPALLISFIIFKKLGHDDACLDILNTTSLLDPSCFISRFFALQNIFNSLGKDVEIFELKFLEEEVKGLVNDIQSNSCVINRSNNLIQYLVINSNVLSHCFVLLSTIQSLMNCKEAEQSRHQSINYELSCPLVDTLIIDIVGCIIRHLYSDD